MNDANRPDAIPNALLLQLTSDEAFVLFEFLSRACDRDVLQFDDFAEQLVLCGLLAQLQPKIDMVFDSRYSDLLADARSRIRS